MDGMANLSGWRWLFILQGAVTLVLAIVAFFVLPDEPLTTHWLTPEERTLAHERIARDTVQNDGATTSIRGIVEAAKDPKVWLFVLMQVCTLERSFPAFVEIAC
jgi:sugar phosphate permease